MGMSVETVLTDNKGVVIGALVNVDGTVSKFNRDELVKFKRQSGNFDNAVITYKGYVKAKNGEKLRREVYEEVERG